MTPRRKYDNPEWTTRMAAITRMRDELDKSSAMASIALNEESPEFAEAFALGVYTSSTDANVRRLALLTLGHSARRHGKIAFAESVLVLKAALEDKRLCGTAEDSLNDIRVFVSPRKPRKQSKKK